MNKQTKQTKPQLIRKYHTLAGKIGMSDDDKRAMLHQAYGVTSSTELRMAELQQVCVSLEHIANPKLEKMDKARKRLIAAIFAWRKALHMPTNIAEVKAIACRAAKKDYFNQIPLEALRSLYYAFLKKTKDLQFVEHMTSETLEHLIINN